MYRWRIPWPSSLRNPAWAAALLLAVAAVTLSCIGGGDDDADAPAGAPAAGAAAPASDDAPQQAASLQSPAALDSFRYDVSIELSGIGASDSGDDSGGGFGISLDLNFKITMEGAVVAPDREWSRLEADLGLLKISTETIRIGDQAWVRELDGEWQVQTLDGDSLADAFSFSPQDFFGDDDVGDGLGTLRSVLDLIGGKSERVNGVDAVRYDLTSEQFATAFPDGGLPGDAGGDVSAELGDFEVTIWIARDSGIPVRMLLEGSNDVESGEGSVRVELNIRDLNSDGIEIEPPI